jgi:hypothetical protein
VRHSAPHAGVERAALGVSQPNMAFH